MSALMDHLWVDICAVTDIPQRGARNVAGIKGPIAIFRTGDDQVFALIDRCPQLCTRLLDTAEIGQHPRIVTR